MRVRDVVIRVYFSRGGDSIIPFWRKPVSCVLYSAPHLCPIRLQQLTDYKWRAIFCVLSMPSAGRLILPNPGRIDVILLVFKEFFGVVQAFVMAIQTIACEYMKHCVRMQHAHAARPRVFTI